MKTIWRNFLSVLRRFKTATLLNVLGLSIAFAAFMMILMQVDYDRNFDSCHRDAETIARVDLINGEGSSQAIICRPLARNFTASSPHIKAGVIMSSWSTDWFFNIDRAGEKVNYMESTKFVSSGMMQVFHFDLVEGNEQVLNSPNSLLIPESLAHKLFAGESAVGKQLHSVNQSTSPKTVGAVYKDFSRNSSLSNIIYAAMSEKENYDNWGNWNYFFFVRTDGQAEYADLLANFEKELTTESTFTDNYSWDKNNHLRMTSLKDLHFLANVNYDNMPKASQQTLTVLLAIAFIILIIAGINFTNFSTAITPMRVKSINTQKVLGSSDSVLRGCLLVEAVVVSLVAYLISLGLLLAVRHTPIAALVDADLSFAVQPLIVGATALLAVVVGLVAGLYPAFYSTSFPPALVLKGSFGLSPKGRKLRNVLISIQFVASFALIIGALFMYLQNYYMQHAPLGYEKDQVIVTSINYTINKSREAFSNQLRTFPGISDVTYSEMLLASSDSYMGWGRDYKDKEITYQCIPVSPSFLKVMGVEVKSGRGFRPEDDQKEHGVYIFNEKARATYDLQLNDKIGDDEIVGFMPDVKFASFRTEVSPMAFFVWGKQRWGGGEVYFNQAYVRVKAGSDMRAALEHVRTSLAKFDSEFPFDVRFYDAVLQQTYEKELKITSLITLFSLVAIFISIVGVFGLVVFESEYRRKEISLRKVMGATTGEILLMFNRTYLIILALCFVLGAPMAYFSVDKWLENFAYRTPMYAWVFVVAFALVALITLLTVTFQNWHVANENPVKNIKSE
ncbi:MAG: FtsX-like permease family protein [Tannerellaceae bacterium]